MFKELVLITLIAASLTQGFGQNESYELPVYYGQFFNDPQVNTLDYNNESDLKISFAHRRNSNNFGGINTSLFSSQFKLKAKKEDSHHTIGVQMISDKEGFLIRRNRAAITYARHLKMNDKFNIAGGFSAGFYNFSIVSNDVTGGYSSYAFDGSFSLAMYSDKTKIGLNINQFTNSTIRPVDQDIILMRHLNLFVSHSFKLGEEVNFIPNLISRYSKNNNSVFTGFVGSLGAQFLFKEKFMAGASAEKSNGYYFFGGFEQIALWNSNINLTLSYFVPNGKNLRSNVQLFEVFISSDINFKNNIDRGVTSFD